MDAISNCKGRLDALLGVAEGNADFEQDGLEALRARTADVVTALSQQHAEGQVRYGVMSCEAMRCNAMRYSARRSSRTVIPSPPRSALLRLCYTLCCCFKSFAHTRSA